MKAYYLMLMVAQSVIHICCTTLKMHTSYIHISLLFQNSSNKTFPLLASPNSSHRPVANRLSPPNHMTNQKNKTQRQLQKIKRTNNKTTMPPRGTKNSNQPNEYKSDSNTYSSVVQQEHSSQTAATYYGPRTEHYSI